jgi:hypothetical protein
MLDQFLIKQKCPKCNGSILLDSDIMPDNTYELYCLNCGNRVFSTELIIMINILVKLSKQLVI